MYNSKIVSYLEQYLRQEHDISSPYQSNGDLERQFIYLSQLVKEQDIVIKLLSKQIDTNTKFGLSRRLAEFKNTFWRILIGSSDTILHQYKEMELNSKKSNFLDFIQKLGIEPNTSENHLNGRLLIDVTSTSQITMPTGIQRVVSELSRKLMSPNVFPVLITDNGLLAQDKATQQLTPIHFRKDDIFLMADASIDYSENVIKAMAENRSVGGKNVTFVYDLIPLHNPLTCGAAIPYKFDKWFKGCALKSHLILCNTNTVALQLKELTHIYDYRIDEHTRIEYFQLGSEIEKIAGRSASDDVRTIIDVQTNIFLSVGTIEPRKGYSIALDAVENAWNKGNNFIYVIAGRYGWSQESVRKRILEHHEYGTRLFWLNNIDDSDLSILYASSRALIYSSIEEGFGLPLIESAQHGLPSIISDIPVFREIAGDEAVYFEVANAEKLAEKIVVACNKPKNKPHLKFISWEVSKSSLLEHLRNL